MTARMCDDVSSLISRPLSRCPSCGSVDLEPVVESVVQDVHFLCRACNHCWDVALGSVHRVTPGSCLGCPGRGPCENVYAADHGGHA
jgi:hypothetical protein